MAVRIGELLLREQRITAAQLEEALEHQKSNGGKLGHNLVKLGFAKDEEIASLLSRQYGVPSINLSQFDIDAGVIKVVPAATAQKYEIVPVSRTSSRSTTSSLWLYPSFPKGVSTGRGKASVRPASM